MAIAVTVCDAAILRDDRKILIDETAMTSIQAQLAQDLADVSWKDIIPHCQRDAVIVVYEGLDIVEAGVAIAQDNVAQVQVWIEEQLLQKPTTQQLSLWNQSPDRFFSVLIVQPYVLVSAPLSSKAEITQL